MVPLKRNYTMSIFFFFLFYMFQVVMQSNICNSKKLRFFFFFFIFYFKWPQIKNKVNSLIILLFNELIFINNY